MVSTKNKLFFFKIHLFFKKKNLTIRIFNYLNGVQSQLIGITGVLLYFKYTCKIL